MKTLIFPILLVILVALSVHAKKNRAPNQSLSSKITIYVSYGERLTNFEIDSNQNKSLLTMKNNAGISGSKALTNSDFQFLVGKIEALPKESNDTQFCSRNFIQVENGSTKRFACLGGKNKLSEELLDLVNLLTLQF